MMHDQPNIKISRNMSPSTLWIYRLRINYRRRWGSHFLPTLVYAFPRGMAVETVGTFQMLRSLCVIHTNFTIWRHFLLKLWR